MRRAVSPGEFGQIRRVEFKLLTKIGRAKSFVLDAVFTSYQLRFVAPRTTELPSGIESVRVVAHCHLPHEIECETNGPASVSDAIELLRGTQAILTAVGPLIAASTFNVPIERITVSIKEFSGGSRKEAVLAAPFLIPK